MSVRSMATLVKTKDCRIVIDPSAALGPSRYGLPPSKEEEAALEKALNGIHEVAEGSDILVLTHYHYDHFDQGGKHFEGKTVYAKDITKDINKSQTGRGTLFKEIVGGKCDLIYADGKEFECGGTKIKFSPPMFHGPEGIRLGYVLMVAISETEGSKGEKGKQTFVYASDVQGPVTNEAADWIIAQKPDLIYMDGPPILFLGWKFSYKNLEAAVSNFKRLLKETKAKIILDHHLLRSLDYKEKFPVWEEGRVMTAAEFLGKKNTMLEAHRKELWGNAKK